MVAFRTSCFSDRSPRTGSFENPQPPCFRFMSWDGSARSIVLIHKSSDKRSFSHTYVWIKLFFPSWVLYLINACNFSYICPILFIIIESSWIIIGCYQYIFYYIFVFVVNFSHREHVSIIASICPGWIRRMPSTAVCWANADAAGCRGTWSVCRSRFLGGGVMELRKYTQTLVI